MRRVLEDGSGGSRGKGGARLSSHALVSGGGGPGKRRKKERAGKGLSEDEGRIANQLASCLSGWPMSSLLAHNVSRQGRFTSMFGSVGRCPGIKDSARAGSRHSGVRLEVSLGVLSVGG